MGVVRLLMLPGRRPDETGFVVGRNSSTEANRLSRGPVRAFNAPPAGHAVRVHRG
jgi:hypothetical protein